MGLFFKRAACYFIFSCKQNVSVYISRTASYFVPRSQVVAFEKTSSTVTEKEEYEDDDWGRSAIFYEALWFASHLYFKRLNYALKLGVL